MDHLQRQIKEKWEKLKFDTRGQFFGEAAGREATTLGVPAWPLSTGAAFGDFEW